MNEVERLKKENDGLHQLAAYWREQALRNSFHNICATWVCAGVFMLLLLYVVYVT